MDSIHARFRWAAAALSVLLVVACTGSKGDPGAAGSAGTSCTVHDGATGKVITCTDGTSVTVADGTNGTSCTVVKNSNGTRTISCADGSTVTVFDSVIDYGALTLSEKADAALNAVVTSVSFPDDGRPVVALKVSDRHGYGVKGLSALAAGSTTAMVTTWRFGLLKLVPGGTAGVNGSANDTWVSYLAANDHSSASSETAAVANLTDNGDGSYAYRFAKVINAGATAAGTTYEADKAHRLIILLYASGNPFTPINVVKDLVPSTGADVSGQNEKVDAASCLECHTTFRAIASGTGELGAGEFHGGVRYDFKACVACHNDQRRFNSSGDAVAEPTLASDGTWAGNAGVLNGEAILDLPVFIHKIHMGEDLKLKGGNYAGLPKLYETTYPQDVRNCVKCHRAPAPMAANWQSKPSRRACGACHDKTSFVSPAPNGRTLHSGGAQANDNNCATCHSASGGAGDVPSKHLPVNPPDSNSTWAGGTNSNTNAAYIAATGFVPPGAKVISYDVSSVSAWTDTGVTPNVLRPQIVFKFKMADPTASPPVAATDVVFQTYATGTTLELMPNFVGSPSAYFVYAVPQDGKSAPADFNASASGYIKNIWNGTATSTGAGTISGPDSSGYYTLKLTGVVIPANATMLTGGIGYSYSLGTSANGYSSGTPPLVQTNVPGYPYTQNQTTSQYTGGLIVPPPDVAKAATGYAARRAIVENARCANCHVSLGVGPTFHAGQRNDAPTCSFCHNPNRSSSAWSANAKDFVHAIHGAEKRGTPFTWHQVSASSGYWGVTYPAVLNKCETCHLPGTYDFSGSAAAAAVPNLLPSTVGQGRYNSSATTNPSGYLAISPYVVSNNQTDYGYGFATSNITATLPDGLSGSQGNVTCSPAAPCTCTAANPCSVTISAPYTVNNVPVTFTQKVGQVTTTCSDGASCTCVTNPATGAATNCTGTIAACTTAAPCQAQATTLVVSPIAAACSACHDSATAIDHMQVQGASFFEPRSSALVKPEQCLLCHGPGKLASVGERHAVKP